MRGAVLACHSDWQGVALYTTPALCSPGILARCRRSQALLRPPVSPDKLSPCGAGDAGVAAIQVPGRPLIGSPSGTMQVQYAGAVPQLTLH